MLQPCVDSDYATVLYWWETDPSKALCETHTWAHTGRRVTPCSDILTALLYGQRKHPWWAESLSTGSLLKSFVHQVQGALGLLYFSLFQSLIETTRIRKRSKRAQGGEDRPSDNGWYRLTMQAELKARPGGSSFESQEKLESEPPSPQVHFHGLSGMIKKAGLTGFH